MDPVAFVLRTFTKQEREEVYIYIFFFLILKFELTTDLQHMEVLNVHKLIFQLNFTLHDGLEAVRILLLEGFDRSATFVNSAKKIEQTG